MLGKLIKYEFRATRKMLLLYGLLLVLAAAMAFILRFSFNTDGDLFIEAMGGEGLGSGLFAFFTFIVSAAYAFMSAFIFASVLFGAINRFRVNLLGNQGYLMHTLPVKAGQHVLAKNITSIIWTILGVVAVLISYMIIGTILFDIVLWNDFVLLLHKPEVQALFTNARFWGVSAGVVVLVIISVGELYFRIYASMAAGYSLNNHRAAASIGAFIVLSIVKSIPHGILLPTIPNISTSTGWWFLIFEIIYTAVWGIVYYIIAAQLLSKRLNLQ